MDAAWHSVKFLGYMEIPSNNFPPTPVLTEARVLAAAAAAQQQQQPGDASSPLWEEEEEEAGTTAAAAASAHKHRKPTHVKRQSEPASTVRTLNVAMHGLEALTALHKITHGARSWLLAKQARADQGHDGSLRPCCTR
jgi:hypothetical protein